MPKCDGGEGDTDGAGDKGESDGGGGDGDTDGGGESETDPCRLEQADIASREGGALLSTPHPPPSMW